MGQFLVAVVGQFLLAVDSIGGCQAPVSKKRVRHAGYLETVAEKLLIDFVTVSAYAVGDSQIIVPQRIDCSGRDLQCCSAALDLAHGRNGR